jgi:hypothetical protein
MLELDADHGKATIGNLLLVVWRKETTLAAYRRVGEHMVELARAYPGGIGVLQLVELRAVPPNAETKRELIKIMGLAEGLVKHYSVVHEATGFSAAIFRALVSGINLFVRPTFPNRAFSSLVEAAAWHAQEQRALHQTPFNEVGIVSSMQTLRTAVASFSAATVTGRSLSNP